MRAEAPMNPEKRSPLRRRDRRCGAEMIEFVIVFVPFLAMMTVLMDVGWAAFCKCTLQYAARVGVRNGITMNKTTAAAAPGGPSLTGAVKALVQQNSFGFLRDTSLIHVNYYQPPAFGSTASLTNVSTETGGASPGNQAGNIMVVSIDSYVLPALIVRIFSWRSLDNSSTTINVSSADVIERLAPTELAPLGVAP